MDRPVQIKYGSMIACLGFESAGSAVPELVQPRAEHLRPPPRNVEPVVGGDNDRGVVEVRQRTLDDKNVTAHTLTLSPPDAPASSMQRLR